MNSFLISIIGKRIEHEIECSKTGEIQTEQGVIHTANMNADGDIDTQVEINNHLFRYYMNSYTILDPIYVPNMFTSSLLSNIIEEVNWINVGAPRDECFMSSIGNVEYQYRKNVSYFSVDMTPTITSIMNYLNDTTDASYDICFLNLYKDETKFLGWHSDDSPSLDSNHPIASISFGAEREIWVKKVGETGHTSKNNRFMLKSGSAFIMPANFQRDNLHRIPKHSAPCSMRISLTFRKVMK